MKKLTILGLALALMAGCGKPKNNPAPELTKEQVSTQLNDIWVNDSKTLGTWVHFKKNGIAEGFTTSVKYEILNPTQVKIGKQIYDLKINGDKLTLSFNFGTPGGIRKVIRVYSRSNSEAMKQADKVRKANKDIQAGPRSPKSDPILEN